jgi:GDPmannose 4,6-dehydratase
MTAIIFGANGQDGHYLRDLFEKQNFKVTAVSRNGNDLNGDVTDTSFVTGLIKQQQPDFIFNFAANSSTRHEFAFENHETIGRGCLNILEAVKTVCPKAKVFLSGSGLQFENKGEPIDESMPFAANNAYAVERIHSVYLARYYRKLGLKVYVGYFFNHDSPLRGNRHVSKMITEAVNRIRNGSKEIIEIGDLHTRKEWGFAGDMVRAVWTLVQQDVVFEAVIGTGKAYSIGEWIDECFRQAGLESAGYVKQKENFRSEFNILVSNPQKIMSLGWKPEVDFSALATMMLKQ